MTRAPHYVEHDHLLEPSWSGRGAHDGGGYAEAEGEQHAEDQGQARGHHWPAVHEQRLRRARSPVGRERGRSPSQVLPSETP